MKVSKHRYRQSRQGATLISSKKFLPIAFGCVIGFGLVVVLAFVGLTGLQ
jgi:hypothetical protein